MHLRAESRHPLQRFLGVALAVMLPAALLAACGGGSGSEATDNPPPTVTEDVASGEYQLVVEIDSADVAELESAGQQVIVVRPLGPTTDTNVAWTTFAPADSSEISWGSDLYAFGWAHGGTAPFEVGDLLDQNPQVTTDVAPGLDATLMEGATPQILEWMTSPSSSNGTLALRNTTQYSCAMGLGAEIALNGTGYNSPFFVLNEGPGYQMRATPTDTVLVFIGSNDIEASQVIGPITAPTLAVDLSTNPSQTISYDNSTGAFVAAS